MAVERVKNADGTSTALSIIKDYQAQIDEQINKMKNTWEALRPRYQSRGATTFFHACDEIERHGRGLMTDMTGVIDALGKAGLILNNYTAEEEAAAQKVADGNDVGASAHGYQYAITHKPGGGH